MGQDSFNYTVSDGIVTDTATVNITVTNQAPQTYDEFASTVHDQTVSVWPYFYDGDGDLVNVSDYTQPASGTVSVNAGEFTYTPATGFVGQDSFTYTVSDSIVTDTATVSITVTNQAPQR